MMGEVRAAEKLREKISRLSSQHRTCELSSGRGHNIARMVRLSDEMERLSAKLVAHPGYKALTAKDAAIKRLRAIQSECDTEGGHIEADDILCDLLATIGFEDVIAEFRKVEKWYA